jgi:hypothetical protein
LKRIGDKSITKNELLTAVRKQHEALQEIVEGTGSSKPAIRYGCSKALMNLSVEYPDRLYPFMDSFVSLLDTKHRILTWNALTIIANAHALDHEVKWKCRNCGHVHTGKEAPKTCLACKHDQSYYELLAENY